MQFNRFQGRRERFLGRNYYGHLSKQVSCPARKAFVISVIEAVAKKNALDETARAFFLRYTVAKFDLFPLSPVPLNNGHDLIDLEVFCNNGTIRV